MWLPVALIGWFLVIVLGLLNLFFIFGRLVGSTSAKLVVSMIGVEEDELWPRTTRRMKWLQRGYSLSWILVGISVCLVLIVPEGSLITLLPSYFILFFTFRSGANLTSRVIRGHHDQGVIRRLSDDTKTSSRLLSKIVVTSVVLGLIMSILFVSVWAVIYVLFSASIRMAFELGFNIYSLIVWLSGLGFGIIYGAVLSRGAPFLLLRDEIAIVSLLSLRGARKRVLKVSDDMKGRAARVIKKTREAPSTIVEKAEQVQKSTVKRLKSLLEEDKEANS